MIFVQSNLSWRTTELPLKSISLEESSITMDHISAKPLHQQSYCWSGKFRVFTYFSRPHSNAYSFIVNISYSHVNISFIISFISWQSDPALFSCHGHRPKQSGYGSSNVSFRSVTIQRSTSEAVPESSTTRCEGCERSLRNAFAGGH